MTGDDDRSMVDPNSSTTQTVVIVVLVVAVAASWWYWATEPGTTVSTVPGWATVAGGLFGLAIGSLTVGVGFRDSWLRLWSERLSIRLVTGVFAGVAVVALLPTFPGVFAVCVTCFAAVSITGRIRYLRG